MNLTNRNYDMPRMCLPTEYGPYLAEGRFAICALFCLRLIESLTCFWVVQGTATKLFSFFD